MCIDSVIYLVWRWNIEIECGLDDHFLSVFAFNATVVLKWKLKFVAFDVPET